jgi:hypothetical protein
MEKSECDENFGHPIFFYSWWKITFNSMVNSLQLGGEEFNKFRSACIPSLPSKPLELSEGNKASKHDLAKIYQIYIIGCQLIVFIFKSLQREGLWSLITRCARFVRNPDCQGVKKIYSVMTHPQIILVVQRYPRNYFKCFGKYISLSLDSEKKVLILSNHYHLIASRFNSGFMKQILEGYILLWSELRDGNYYSIQLNYAHGTDKEGDLCLVFKINSSPLFFLNFTFIAGDIFVKSSAQTLFIGRLQGIKGGFDLIKFATKNLDELSPSTLLILAAEGVAKGLGITTMVGVNNRSQISIGDRMHLRKISNVYDEFWESIGGEKLNNSYYIFDLNNEEFSLDKISSNHRSRVKRKRFKKDEIVRQVEENFRMSCLA